MFQALGFQIFEAQFGAAPAPEDASKVMILLKPVGPIYGFSPKNEIIGADPAIAPSII